MFKLEVGKFYKTAEGTKIEVLKVGTPRLDCPIIVWSERHGVQHYTENGSSSLVRYAVVGEWRDPVERIMYAPDGFLKGGDFLAFSSEETSIHRNKVKIVEIVDV